MTDEKGEHGSLIEQVPPLAENQPTSNRPTEGNEAATILHPDYELTRDYDRPWSFNFKQIPQKLLWLFYIRTWIPEYKREWLKPDIKSGLTVVGMAIPQAIAYTGVIGVSPSLGLYTACIGLSIYPLFGSARHLTLGCSSLTTILTAAILINFAPANNPHNSLAEYTTQVKTLTLMAGVFYSLLGVFGLGFITSFLAYPVLLGFTGGAAVQIACTQIRTIFALNGTATDVISNLKLLKYLDKANWRAFACFITTLFVLLSFKVIPRKWPNWKYSKQMKAIPMTLILVIFFTIINFGGKFLHHDKAGTWNKGTVHAPDIVGSVSLTFPKKIDVDTSLISRYPNTYLYQVVSMCVVEFAAFYSVAGSYALKHEYDLFPTRELFAHGIINLLLSMFGGYPAGGVIVHASLAEQAGARTLMFNWFSASIVILVMILFSALPHMIFWLPRSVLAGIVWNACIGMFPFEKMIELAKVDTRDSYIVLATLLCTTFWGIFEGIEVGFALSVLLLLQRTSKPHSAVMGRLPYSNVYGGITTWPDAITTESIILFRVDGALYFGNCNFMKRAIQVLVERNRRQGKRIYYFILDCHAMNDLDSSGVLTMDALHKYLQQNQIVLILTGVKYPVMKLIKRSPLVELIGVDHFFDTVFDAHMDIYVRTRLAQGLEIPVDSPYDYIDDKGTNLIHFGDVTIGQLERPFNESEKEKLVLWNPYKLSHSDHPLNKVKKGFELNRPFARISLALRPERIAVEVTSGGQKTDLNVPDEAIQVA